MSEYILIIILGAVFGSFLNVLIHRLPLEKSIIFPPSSCPNCQEKIKPYDNIPIISYIILLRKCRYCKCEIPIIYPLIEIGASFIFLALFIKIDELNSYYFMLSIIFSLLLALSVIDIKFKEIPDSLNLTILTLAIVHTFEISNLQNALILAGGFVFLRFYVSFFLKKEALGEGDIPVAGAIGAILGLWLSLFAIFLSAIIALVFIIFSRNREIPYVPYLALAMFITYLFDEKILKLLEHLYG